MIKNQALQQFHILNKSGKDFAPKRIENLIVAVNYLTSNEKWFTLYRRGGIGYSIRVNEPASNGNTYYSLNLSTEKSRITLEGMMAGYPVYTGKLTNREALDYIQDHSNSSI